jgi:phage-related protein
VINLYKIRFYKDKQGRKPVREYIKKLSTKKDQQSKKTLDKIHEYLDVLSLNGKMAGLPYVRHIEGEIWELRPAQDRILFVAWINGEFVLLHQFTKKTQKTPRREIETAKKRLADLKERGLDE